MIPFGIFTLFLGLLEPTLCAVAKSIAPNNDRRGRDANPGDGGGNIKKYGKRECMGIEPTDGFLQAAHWF